MAFQSDGTSGRHSCPFFPLNSECLISTSGWMCHGEMEIWVCYLIMFWADISSLPVTVSTLILFLNHVMLPGMQLCMNCAT